ncbi:50S ribosomal protein L33 [Candidatus Blochmannia ocreatus (nom. nud.)]|uniref:Large ribosomal subunit protein bL33 n=1 Tax=Candidatus Blochmannia ocreatus (nom. nud.) TaxID=251538 RepID=A0ABY4SVI8_9ENTR|nr:50S ribosomal protein L33 [Candidatus Blochmannia ocreatus]URJ25078.1 50S ribosomal protein L33 [Candidatus Blochmannia ocreatus]
MAKEKREIIRLFSESNNRHFYSTTKNKRNSPDKIKLKKFDPILRKHILYVERKTSK